MSFKAQLSRQYQQPERKNSSLVTADVIDVSVSTDTDILDVREGEFFLVKKAIAFKTTPADLTIELDGSNIDIVSLTANEAKEIESLKDVLLPSSADLDATSSSGSIRVLLWGLHIKGGTEWL